MKPNRRNLSRDFFARRVSVVGLARKYGLTRAEVEERVRKISRKGMK